MAPPKKTSEKNRPRKRGLEAAVPPPSAARGRVSPLPAAHPDRFFTVGIGASAGGLESIRVFLKNLPPDSGMAFVLVPHLEPTHVSMMPELLRRETAMQVRQVEDGMAVAPNRIYVIPPDKGMEIREGRLYLEKRKLANQKPIDDFLTSLARDQQQWSIGILFSGMGSDGTLGLRAIIEKGGRTLVQDPDTAKFANMPKSAIDAGLADSVLAPEEMARQLRTYARQGIRPRPPAGPPQDEKTNTMLPKIFGLLRTHTGHDFSSYKRSTILRRIQRRMNLHQIADLGDYVRLLQQNDGERKALFKEILIYVTRFFRDTEAFASLKEKALPLLLKDKPEGAQLRVWVIACSTGEEAYSIAMLLQDAIEHFQPSLAFQIFATDLDADSVAFARAGLYPGTIAADVSPAHLRRFFTKEGGGYRVRKELREKLIFATQDVIRDPPFTRLDLICCRNLLIYMDGELQGRVFPVLHYSLNPGGVLFLGTSEATTGAMDLFTAVDRKWKIYQRQESQRLEKPPLGRVVPAGSHPQEPASDTPPQQPPQRLSTLIEKSLLEAYAPPSVVVNGRNEIVYVHGRTGRYLEVPSGEAKWNLLAMIREGLGVKLPLALQRVRAQNQPLSYRDLRVKTNGGYHFVNLTVKPFPRKEMEAWAMVVFEDSPGPQPAKSSKKPAPGPLTTREKKRLGELEKDLEFARESLQAAVEELQTSNEEQKAISEEYMSTNEELQSANEELESSREEMQSLNEELNTVNSELQQKIDDLALSSEEINIFLDSLEIPSLLVDRDLRIRRFTAQISQIMNLIKTDVGRPFGDIVSLLKEESLVLVVHTVLQSGAPLEKEVRTQSGRVYLLRALPYRSGSRIEGAVLNFIDIHDVKISREQLLTARAALEYMEGIVQTVREPLLVLDRGLKVISANRAFYRTFQAAPAETEGRFLFEMDNRQWDIPELRARLADIIPSTGSFEDFIVERKFPRIGRRKMALNARRVIHDEIGIDRILLAIEDLTPRSAENP